MLQNNKIYCVDVSNVKTSFEFVENNSNRPPFFAQKMYKSHTTRAKRKVRGYVRYI